MFARLVAGATLALGMQVAAAQTSGHSPPPERKPPTETAPAIRRGDPSQNESLSDRLQRDSGVIKPPGNIAPDNTIVPDDPGRIRVIPPPGSPQGDQKVQPK